MRLKNNFTQETRLLFLYCFSCFNCGRSDRGLELHHISGRDDLSPENAIPLCPECHSHANHSDTEEARYKELTRIFLERQNYAQKDIELKMPKIKVKPLSANQLWQGRRFKTPAYKDYEKELFALLPRNYKIPEGELKATFEFGLSNKSADADNCLKGCVDILQKFYDFNDKNIYEITIRKVIVKKGKEYVAFEIGSYTQILGEVA